MILACKEDQLVGSGDTDGAGNGLSFRGTELIICVVLCRPVCIICLLFIVLSILRSTTSCYLSFDLRLLVVYDFLLSILRSTTSCYLSFDLRLLVVYDFLLSILRSTTSCCLRLLVIYPSIYDFLLSTTSCCLIHVFRRYFLVGE